MAASLAMLELDNAAAQSDLARRYDLHRAALKRGNAKAAVRSSVRLELARARAQMANMALRSALSDAALVAAIAPATRALRPRTCRACGDSGELLDGYCPACVEGMEDDDEYGCGDY